MAENNETFLELRNKLYDKAREVNSFSAANIPLTNDSTERKTFLTLYDAVKESREKAQVSFNNVMTKLVNLYEVLYSYCYADIYFRKMVQTVTILGNCAMVIKLTTSNNFQANMGQAMRLLEEKEKNFLKIKTNEFDLKLDKEIDDVLEKQRVNFFEMLKTTIEEYLNNGTELSGASSFSNIQYGYFYRKLIEVINGLKAKLNSVDKVAPVMENLQFLNDSLYDFNEFLSLVMSECGQQALDCLYSWEYIESTRQTVDSFYYAEFLSEFKDLVSKLKETLRESTSINTTNANDVDTDNLRLKSLSQLQAVLDKIVVDEDEILDSIELIRKEKENYEVIFPLDQEYGKFMIEGLDHIDEIFNNAGSVKPVSNAADIKVDTTVGELLNDSSAAGVFEGSQFIVPTYTIKGGITNTDVYNYNYDRWVGEFRVVTGINDQIENSILLYLGSFISYFLPEFSGEETANIIHDNNAYVRMTNIAVRSILDKKILVFEEPNPEDEMYTQKLEQYKKYTEYMSVVSEEEYLIKKHTLKVSADFENEQISSNITMFFPDLVRLSNVKYEHLIRRYILHKVSSDGSVLKDADGNEMELEFFDLGEATSDKLKNIYTNVDFINIFDGNAFGSKYVKWGTEKNPRIKDENTIIKATKNIKFLIYKALLYEKDRVNYINKLLSVITNGQYEEPKTCFLVHLLLEVINDVMNIKETEELTRSILIKYMHVFDELYSETANITEKYLSKTLLYQFVVEHKDSSGLKFYPDKKKLEVTILDLIGKMKCNPYYLEDNLKVLRDSKLRSLVEETV